MTAIADPRVSLLAVRAGWKIFRSNKNTLDPYQGGPDKLQCNFCRTSPRKFRRRKMKIGRLAYGNKN